MHKPHPDDIEQDLGQKLSPLGSTSSLQDLIESNSGEVASESQNTFTWTTLERQKMAKADNQMPEETVEVQENGKTTSSTCEDNSEDVEEHVTSYLEHPPLKVLEKKFTEEEDDGNENSRKSSSSGSYSVTSALAGQKMEKGLAEILILEGQTSSFEHTTGSVEGYVSSLDQEMVPECNTSFESPVEVIEKERPKEAKREAESPLGSRDEPYGARQAEPEPESKPTPAMVRKQELTLDLQREAASLPFKSPSQDITSSFSPDESASENSIMWHRLPMGTGDVQKKRQAFERQIRCLSEDTKPKVLNGKVKTPSSGGVRKIVSEERATGSPVGAGGGLARSPAMHSGFRTEDWVVERTPVNTPVGDRVLVGMINLSDEEASFRGSSEDLCKSSGATTPQGSINSNSFGPTATIDLTKTETETATEPALQLSQEEPEAVRQEPAPAQPEVIPQAPVEVPKVEKVATQEVPVKAAAVKPDSAVGTPSGAAVGEKPAGKNGDQPVPLMAPPAGFGDSPEHVPHKRRPGFHEALADQVMPHEELLIAEDFAPPAVPTLHIAESFQSQEQLSSGKSESVYTSAPSAAASEVATTVSDYKVVESEASPAATAPSTASQTLERQTKRKMSSTSVSSRTSGHSSHRSRSRSRSKERLLSKLAHSGEIHIANDLEDDIAGKDLLFLLEFS